ncbi:MAG: NifU family protein [Flavobacteriaceae bacterium]|nr:NifU family protein [Flavobacteriaceae bacterium]
MENEELKQKVETALDEIRPYLINDGGNISLVSIDSDKVVKVRLEGNCVGCRINQMTMKLGVEETIKKHVPEIKEVLNVA